jgi:drug/metabolite transporter (DMT)-like permease
VTKSTAAYLMLSLAALFWSGNFIAGRALGGTVDPITLNFWRWSLALLILLPLTFRQLKESLPALTAHWRVVVGLGATGIAVFQVLVYAALARTTALNALLILSILPVAIVVLSWAVFRDRITGLQGVGIVISLAGTSVLIAKGELEVWLRLDLGTGELFIMGAVVAWAVYSVLLKLRPAAVPPMALLTATVIVGLALMLPVYLWSFAPLPLSVPVAAALLYIAVFASVLAFLFWNRGVAVVGPNTAGLFIHLMPVFGTVLSITLLGEEIAAYHLVGAALVFIGIAAATRRPSARPAKSAPATPPDARA